MKTAYKGKGGKPYYRGIKMLSLIVQKDTNTLVQHYGRNERGLDLVVGDIHGCINRLYEALSSVGFNYDTDRLFSVGDLVDRGPESGDSLELLSKPWFFAVQGNHEDAGVQFAAMEAMGQPSKGFTERYMKYGGAWMIGKPQVERMDYAMAFASLPYAIEIETVHGLVGVIHADALRDDWSYTVHRLRTVRHQSQLDMILGHITMDRSKLLAGDRTPVKGVHALVVGHTPLRTPLRLGNTYYIDTGAIFGGSFTFLNLNSMEFLIVGEPGDFE
jgi:serine/threonine protein phosphatase 1